MATQTLSQVNFLRVDLRRYRHALRAREKAGHDVDLLLVDEARHLVDGDVDLGLRVDENGVDAVALDPVLLVEHVDRGLGADLRGLRAGGGERAGDIVDKADLDFFLLRERRERK